MISFQKVLDKLMQSPYDYIYGKRGLFRQFSLVWSRVFGIRLWFSFGKIVLAKKALNSKIYKTLRQMWHLTVKHSCGRTVVI